MGVRRWEWNAMETNLRSVAEVPQTPPRFAKTPPPGVEGGPVWVTRMKLTLHFSVRNYRLRCPIFSIFQKITWRTL